MARYKFAELKREWNKRAKPGHKIAGSDGYEALKEEARHTHADTGRREIEMSRFDTRSGNPELLSF